MIVLRNREEAKRDRLRYEYGGNSGWMTDYCNLAEQAKVSPDSVDSIPPAPVAFMIEQDAHCVGLPHFHFADQFQITVAGEGRIGQTQMQPVSGHYASALSPYGPLVAGDAGFSYLTLRNGWDRFKGVKPGLQNMPEARATLKAAREVRGGAQRQLFFDEMPVAPAARGDLAALRESSIRALMPPQSDGLGAWVHRLPPGAAVRTPDPASGGGQYWLVLAGGLEFGETPQSGAWGIFVHAHEAPLAARAHASDGLHLLVLQFPRRAASAERAA